MGHVHQRPHEDGRFAGFVQTAGVTAVELDVANWQVAQIGEGRETAAKPIDGQTAAVLTQQTLQSLCRLQIAHRAVFGQFENQSGSDPPLLQELRQPADKIRIVDGIRGQIDGQRRQVLSGLAEQAVGQFNHPAIQRLGQSGPFRHRHERPGRRQAAIRLPGPQQHLPV